MSDLVDVLLDPDIATGDYVVTRHALPTYVEGVRIAGAVSTFTTGLASLQPLSGADLKLLPEGLHVTDARVLITTADVRVRPEPDTVAAANEDGIVETWAAFHIDGPWIAHGGVHRNVYLARQEIP